MSNLAIRMAMTLLQVVALSIFWTTAVAASNAAELSVQVRTVVDGDDIEVCADSGSCTRIRLCGIDAPERECPGYNEARAALRALVEGKQVRC
jgi:micrococcal nuclease